MMNSTTSLVKRLFNVYNDYAGSSFAGNVYDTEYLCPTLLTFPGGGVPMLLVINNGIIED